MERAPPNWKASASARSLANVSCAAVITCESTNAKFDLQINLSRPFQTTLFDAAKACNQDLSNHLNFAFRAEELWIRDNKALAAALHAHLPLTFTLSPSYQAIKILQDLSNANRHNDWFNTLSSLQSFSKDADFVNEFVSRGGIHTLVEIVTQQQHDAASLSSALSCLQNILDRSSDATTSLTPSFILSLFDIIQDLSFPVSILRPACAVASRLLLTPPQSFLPTSSGNSSNAIRTTIDIYFANHPVFLTKLGGRLNLGDACDHDALEYAAAMAAATAVLGLLLSLLHSSTQKKKSMLFVLVERRVNLRKRVATLAARLRLDANSEVVAGMKDEPADNDDNGDAPTMRELRRLVVEFQRFLVQEWSKWKRAPVVLSIESEPSEHRKLLLEIWEAANFDGNDSDVPGPVLRRLGFASESPRKEFSRIGVFGLMMIHAFATKNQSYFAAFIAEQGGKAQEKKCPFGRVCIEVLELLADHWEISTGYTTLTNIQPLLLGFECTFAATLRLYFRLWVEMEGQNSPDEISRVRSALRCHFKYCMETLPRQIDFGEAVAWFEREMLVTYDKIRQNSAKVNEIGTDQILQTWPFRHLRQRLYEKNYEFIKEQRIGCLITGAWFPVLASATTGSGRVKDLVRFFRLTANRKHLHYGEFTEIRRPTPSLEQLPYKIDISSIAEILTGHSSPVFNKGRDRKRRVVGGTGNTAKLNQENPSLTFSLVSSSLSQEDFTLTKTTALSPTGGGASGLVSSSLADFVCASTAQYSEWVDGFNMLLDKNIATKETAELILQLTESEQRLSLLHVSAVGVGVGSETRLLPGNFKGLVEEEDMPPPPPSKFYYNQDGGGLEVGITGLKTLLSELSQMASVHKLLDVYDIESEED